MFANAQRLSSVTIANPGSGYVLGDIVSLDGWGSPPAGTTQINGIRLWPERRSKLQISGVGAGGTVTGLTILDYGAWENSPTTPFSPYGGTGTGLQLNLVFTLYWKNQPWIVPNSSGLQSVMDLLVTTPASALLGGLATVAINSGGSGYVVSDVVTIAGGTLLNGATAATVNVDAVNGSGAITACHILTYGGWNVQPATPNSVTGGTGTSANLALTFNAPVNRADKAIAMAVEKIRGAIQTAQRIPLSLTLGAIPPESESHCYILALQMLLTSVPTLAAYATRPPQTGGKAPLEQMIFDAKEFITNLRDGKSCEYPSDPDPTFSCAVREGAFNPSVDLSSYGMEGYPPLANDQLGILT